MRICTKFLFGMIVTVVCLCDVRAYEGQVFTEGTLLPCPEGCFCLGDDGMYAENTELYYGEVTSIRNECGKGAPVIKKGVVINGIDAYNMLMQFVTHHDSGFEADEAYAFFESANTTNTALRIISGYAVKDGMFYGGTGRLHVCPRLYPFSAPKSKSLSDCFKYDEKGNKVYYGSANYGNCNISGVKALVEDLQKKLDQANKAAQALQEALNKSNHVTSPSTVSSKTDIDAMKAMIKAGISVSDKHIKKVRK